MHRKLLTMKRSMIGKFGRSTSGATAIEFAILIVPTIYASLYAIDIGHTYMVASSLDSASVILTEQIRSGEARSLTQANFCQRTGLSYCDPEKLGVQVTQLSATAVPSKPLPGSFSMTIPAAGEAVMAVLVYEVSPIAPSLNRDNLVLRAGGFTSAQ